MRYGIVSFIILQLIIFTDIVSAQQLFFYVDCKCEEQKEKFHGRYMPPASLFTDYATFKDHVKWDLIDSRLWDSIYVHNLTAEVYSSESFYSFYIFSFKPIKLNHPEDAFVLNLNPCSGNGNYYSIKMGFSRNYGASAEISDFDYKKFDKTAGSFYDVITKIKGLSDFTVLKNILNQLAYTEDDELTELNGYVNTLIERYEITERELPPFNSSLDNEIDSIVYELEQKEVNIRSLIVRDFVLDEFSDGNNEVNEEEKRRINYIFREQLLTDIDNFLKYSIYPTIIASIYGTAIIGIELSSKILVNTSEIVPVRILAEVAEVKYSTIDGLRAEPISACLPPAILIGTNLVISSGSARIISSRDQQMRYDYSPHNFPFYMADSALLRMDSVIDQEDVRNIDEILKSFTGIVLSPATLQFPYKNKILKSDAAEILINNKICIVEVKLEIAPKQPKKLGQIKLISGTKTVIISLEELEELLNSMDIIYTKPVIKLEKTIDSEINGGKKYLHFYIIKLPE